MIDIPEIFKNNDTLYHYTDYNKAIKLILKNESLKFSPLVNAYDRIESSEFKFGTTHRSRFDEKTNYFKYNAAKERIEKLINKTLNNTKSICFCKNEIPKNELTKESMLSFDNLGFLRSRMWEQYGDNYNGVCLVFQNQKFLKIKILIMLEG